jgi:cytochrome c-type biogenesis protein CcmF
MTYTGEWLLPGELGHAAVLLSFFTALLGVISFGAQTRGIQGGRTLSWQGLGRWAFGLHALAVVSIGIVLFVIIYQHRYEYHYAWSHASRALPTHYIISAFWEGQEGSFLLWMFWNVVLGLSLIRTAGRWEAPVMVFVSLAQLMLSSMLLGLYVGDIKIGSSPFVLLRETMQAPIFQQTDYLKFITDGNGLNPLLQNPWMVIHPPVLFLGFASTLVPFAYAMGGLATWQYGEWVRPALPWTLFATAMLGTGIVMGAAWAYESLNFGGYWAWDPVENASLIPWLCLVGGLHLMHAWEKRKQSLPSATILIILSYLLVLYATFLTRSGILGDSSVHAFTDLGMSGQLLVFLFAFVISAAILLALSWKRLPRQPQEEPLWSREFWLFMGSLVMALGAFQVLFSTSIPVWNQIFGTNLAPPADAVAYYNRWQLPFAVLILLLGTLAHLLPYKGRPSLPFKKWLLFLIVPSLLLTAGIAVPLQYTNWTYILLLASSLLAILGHLGLLWQQRKKWLRSGGAVAHIGFALMMVGVLISASRREVVSVNRSGYAYGGQFDEKQNRENVLLWKGEALDMPPYRVTYLGDSVSEPNHYYKVQYEECNKNGDVVDRFVLLPNAQINPKMGLIATPDTRHYAFSDLYTHVTQVMDKEATGGGKEWGPPEPLLLSGSGDTVMVRDGLLIFEGITTELPGDLTTQLQDAEVKVAAQVTWKAMKETYQLRPVYAIRNGVEFRFDDVREEAGINLSFRRIHPDKKQIELAASVAAPEPRDYIIMKALRFPMINLLWLGAVLTTLGLSMAVVVRHREKNAPPSIAFSKNDDKG